MYLFPQLFIIDGKIFKVLPFKPLKTSSTLLLPIVTVPSNNTTDPFAYIWHHSVVFWASYNVRIIF